MTYRPGTWRPVRVWWPYSIDRAASSTRSTVVSVRPRCDLDPGRPGVGVLGQRPFRAGRDVPGHLGHGVTHSGEVGHVLVHVLVHLGH